MNMYMYITIKNIKVNKLLIYKFFVIFSLFLNVFLLFYIRNVRYLAENIISNEMRTCD